jgi:hypothetical protein
VLCLVGIAGCRTAASQSGGVTITVDISPTTVVGQPAAVAGTLADASGAPITGARAEVEGNMRHAGMAPVVAQAEEESAGRYVVPGFVFTMGGDWVVTVRATLPDGRKVEKEVEVPGVPTACGADL